MNDALAAHVLEEAALSFRKLKEMADRALAQVDDEDLFVRIDPESNSIAVLMQHMSGNMRSRWTHFLTSDGEKPNRERDAEFETAAGATRADVVARWEAGWRCVFDAVDPLVPDDLERTVVIRGERHTVLQALSRQIRHYAMHVGQIVLLAKHEAGPEWRTLSIARGKSREYNAELQA